MNAIISLRVMAAVAVFSLVITALQLSLPLYSMQVFSRVVPTGHLATLAALLLLLIGLNVVSFFIDAARSLVMSRVALRFEMRLHAPMAAHAMNLAHQGQSPLNDLAEVKNFLSGPMALALLDAPWSILFVVAMFALHRMLGSLSLCIFLIAIGWSCVSHYLTHRHREQVARTRLAEQHVIRTAAADRDVTNAMGLQVNYQRRLSGLHALTMSCLERLEGRMAWVDAGSRFLRNIFQIAILTTAAVLTLDQQVEVGAIVASTMLFSRALAPIERLSGGFSQISAAHLAVKRLLKLAEVLRASNDRLALPPLVGHLELRGVSVYTKERSKPILNYLNLEVLPGSVVVLVGSEGAGKSTFARVFCGALVPNAGEVRIDGSAIADFSSAELGRQVGYLPEVIRLEQSTVASIIARSGPIDSDAVIQAATLAGAHSMIQSLPAGYDTIIRVDDQSISAGQRQRLALARAFYLQPKLIVLDEPTCHLDDEGETSFFTAVESLKKSGSTLIIVSRYPRLLHLADKFLFLKDGRIEHQSSGQDLRRHTHVRLASERSV